MAWYSDLEFPFQVFELYVWCGGYVSRRVCSKSRPEGTTARTKIPLHSDRWHGELLAADKGRRPLSVTTTSVHSHIPDQAG